MISFQEIQTAINIYGHYIATAAAAAVALRNHYLRFNRQKDTFFASIPSKASLVLHQAAPTEITWLF